MKEILDFLLNDDNSRDLLNFKQGYLTALVVMLGLTIIFLFLRYIYRYPKRSRGIELKGSKGSIFITSGAISDLVKSIGDEYELIEISKVSLLEDKDVSYLELQVSIENDKESSFITLSDDIQNNIITTLKERFGIENVKEVKLNLRKIETRKSSF
ncbi:MAG TPA: alkaline shock response membrane anchor protein AmaP [Lentisphaeria bacterium]|nr:MAG: hypothetical protein A2X45_21290 [Lentisphaerae bacterium GWF2_50_93]HCE45462.1 alkaline shock response membrane anchor protein AmaP [Lentisphaeria bacterium]